MIISKQCILGGWSTVNPSTHNFNGANIFTKLILHSGLMQIDPVIQQIKGKLWVLVLITTKVTQELCFHIF